MSSEPFEFHETSLPGVFILTPGVFKDNRGVFVKTFHREAFLARGLEADFAEQFYSISRRGVLRGLHFQLPPHHHAKLVTCLNGTVLDAVVDLRTDSPCFGQHVTVTLSRRNARMIYIPRGCAHGFLSLTNNSLLLYNQTSVHAPHADAGIRWDSANITWPLDSPVTSIRDAGFPGLADFISPFKVMS